MQEFTDFEKLLASAKTVLDSVLMNTIGAQYDQNIDLAIQLIVDALRQNTEAISTIEGFLQLTEERKIEVLNTLSATRNGLTFDISSAPDLAISLTNIDLNDREKVNVVIADYLFMQVLNRLGLPNAE